MARYPRAVWRPLPEQQGSYNKTQVIVHTMVGSLEGTYNYFRQNAITTESTFGVGDTGRVEQWMDSAEKADANYRANERAVSIETEDRADPNRPWTPAQMSALVALIAWCCRTHDIPARWCRTPTDPGIGWHAMFGAPSAWTNAPGKTCPGAVRISQLRTEVFPRVVRALASTTQEDDVTEQDKKDIIEGILNYPIRSRVDKTQTFALKDYIASLDQRLTELDNQHPGEK